MCNLTSPPGLTPKALADFYQARITEEKAKGEPSKEVMDCIAILEKLRQGALALDDIPDSPTAPPKP
jgi:hypothetical protein